MEGGAEVSHGQNWLISWIIASELGRKMYDFISPTSQKTVIPHCYWVQQHVGLTLDCQCILKSKVQLLVHYPNLVMGAFFKSFKSFFDIFGVFSSVSHLRFEQLARVKARSKWRGQERDAFNGKASPSYRNHKNGKFHHLFIFF